MTAYMNMFYFLSSNLSHAGAKANFFPHISEKNKKSVKGNYRRLFLKGDKWLTAGRSSSR